MGEGDKDFLSATLARKRLLASASSLMLRKTFEDPISSPTAFQVETAVYSFVHVHADL